MRTKHILAVDDDTSTLFAYRMLFKHHNVALQTCDTLDEALRLLTSRSFDAVITDLRLTNEGREEGFTILRCVQVLQPNAKAILVTGYSTDQVKQKAFDLGASFYFEKPVHVEDVFDAMRRLHVIEDEQTGDMHYVDAVE